MKGKLIILVAISIVYCLSCKQNSNAKTAETKGKDTTKFFQLTQYIQSQIKEVNETPFYIYKLDIIDDHTDSTPINKEIFNQIASKFIKPDINDIELKKNYKENIFHDETTKSFTISYAAVDKDLEIQNAEVLLQEDGQTIKRIFIRKFYNYLDSSVIEQLGWKPGERFQINRLVRKADNKEITHQTIVVWNEGKS